MTSIGRRDLLLGGCALGLLSGCAGQIQPVVEPEATKGVALIPRELLFGNRERGAVRISPDGASLAFLGPVDGARNLWVAPYTDPGAARAVTNYPGHGISFFFVWAYDNKHIVFFKDEAGDENYRAHSLDLVSGRIVALTPGPGVRSFFLQRSPRMPEQMLFGHNERDKRYHDIFRINVATGESVLVERNRDFAGFIADSRLRVRYATRYVADGSRRYFERRANGTWREFLKIGVDDTTYPIGLDAEGKTLYWIDSRGRDTAALVAMTTANRASRVLVRDAEADCVGAIMHPVTRRPQAAIAYHARARWQVFDPALREHVGLLDRATPGELEGLERSHDDSRWMASYRRDDGSRVYVRYAPATKTVTPLFTASPALDETPLVKMSPSIAKARDGLDLVCYLSLPKGVGDTQVPPEPLPMVLLVHGGPWSRDSWGYHPTHQWLANRGYAVLSVNYRGSTGFGKAFLNAANREWAGKMHDDLIDAVDWAIDQGIADPKRVAIMGGSYGGYATLVGLTFTPDKFACGVGLFGISNLVTFMNDIPPYWRPWQPVLKARIGADPETEEGRAFLRQRSPLTYVDRIVRPLLIAQGSNDVRVRQIESDQIVSAMQSRKIPVTYLIYPDEGHGFVRRENRLSFNAVAEQFLAQHLGGRAEPIGQDLAGSSLRVRAGAAFVPTLARAVRTG